MKEALEAIISNLVNDKNSMTIDEKADGKNVTFEVKVASQDMGRIIGKEGKIAKSIRTIMKALASKEGKKVIVEFLD